MPSQGIIDDRQELRRYEYVALGPVPGRGCRYTWDLHGVGLEVGYFVSAFQAAAFAEMSAAAGRLA
jgi:hypothetical protein